MWSGRPNNLQSGFPEPAIATPLLWLHFLSQVPDVENPEFFKKMDYLVSLNNKLTDINKMEVPDFLKKLMSAPIVERMVAEVFQVFLMSPKKSGSVDVDAELQTQAVY